MISWVKIFCTMIKFHGFHRLLWIFQKPSTTRMLEFAPFVLIHPSTKTNNWWYHEGPNLIVDNSFIKVGQYLDGVLRTCVVNHFIKIKCWHLIRYLIVMSCAIQSNDYMTKVSSSSSYSSKLI